MEDRKFLLNNLGVIYFHYPDNSIVRCVATASDKILSEYDLISGGSLIDIEARKAIPEDYLLLKSEIYSIEKDNDKRNDLDKFLNDFIKNSWGDL